MRVLHARNKGTKRVRTTDTSPEHHTHAHDARLARAARAHSRTRRQGVHSPALLPRARAAAPRRAHKARPHGRFNACTVYHLDSCDLTHAHLNMSSTKARFAATKLSNSVGCVAAQYLGGGGGGDSGLHTPYGRAARAAHPRPATAAMTKMRRAAWPAGARVAEKRHLRTGARPARRAPHRPPLALVPGDGVVKHVRHDPHLRMRTTT